MSAELFTCMGPLVRKRVKKSLSIYLYLYIDSILKSFCEHSLFAILSFFGEYNATRLCFQDPNLSDDGYTRSTVPVYSKLHGQVNYPSRSVFVEN